MDFGKIVHFFGVLIILLFVNEGCIKVSAQPVNKYDILNKKRDHLIKSFNTSNCTYNPLINGISYNKYYYGVKGHQFYNSKNFSLGSIKIQNENYTDIFLRYDIYNDILNLNFYSGIKSVNIELNKNIITGFNVDNHNFIKYEFPDKSSLNKYNGFFEEIYNGKITILFKWKKYINKTNDTYSGEFFTERMVFLVKGDQFYKIKNKKDILLVLKENELIIKQYLRSKGFVASKATALDYIELIKLYENSL